MASVKVAVRVRPLNQREENMKCSFIIQMEQKDTFITNNKLPTSPTDSLGRERTKRFTYDYSYWSVDGTPPSHAPQQQIYEDLGEDVVKCAYDGYNACVFAYGQTGSGKTYTMMGNKEDIGLIPRICENLFNKMEDTETTYRTEISYLEIYNERVRDLLRDKQSTGRHVNLKVREHPKEGPYVQELSKHLVMNYGDMMELMDRGNSNRTTACTQMNDQSSRSHAIFTIVFTQARFDGDIPSEIHSKIHLVDLAGSERADASGTTGQRLKEGGSINKSLVTLGNVISTLADMSEKPPGARKNVFIPYRDSVLTWLLKDSLGGNAKTIMIATISPADCNYAETLSTLRYANRAKKIVNKPTINEDPNVTLIRELREENTRLKSLLGKNLDYCFAAQEKLNQNEEKVKALTERWASKWQETANVLEEHKSICLRREGSGVVLDSELPYLLALDDNILSTGMRLYHIKEGDMSIGREDGSEDHDIILSGRMVEAEHCKILHQNGEVTLIPYEGALCSVNNVRIHEPTKLSQGAVIRLGRSHLFRFNHPGEAARLREELKVSGTTQLVKVWDDCQWTWSNLSITDSAVGSDIDVEGKFQCCDEHEKLEEKRRQIEEIEEAHCLAEAQRAATLAEQSVREQTLSQKELDLIRLKKDAEHKKKQAEKAQSDIAQLSKNFKQQCEAHIKQQERLIAEQEELERERERFEREKNRARLERQRLRREKEAERERLEFDKQRQEREWQEVQQSKMHLEDQTQKGITTLEQQKEALEHERDAEKKIFKDEMEEIRNLVEKEVLEMRQMAGLGAETVDIKGSSTHTSISSISDDIEELSLKIPDDMKDGILIDKLAESIMAESPTNPALPAELLVKSTVDDTSPELLSPAPSLEDSMSETEGESLRDLTNEQLQTKLSYLSTEVAEIHGKVCQVLERKYSSILSSDDLTSEVGPEVIHRFTSLRPIFEQLERFLRQRQGTDGNNGLGCMKEELVSQDQTLNIINQFWHIHETLQEIQAAIKARDFLDVIDKLAIVGRLLVDLDVERQEEANVRKILQTEVCILREKLLYELAETWNKLLQWTHPLETRRLADKPRTITLQISESEDNIPLMKCTVQAMHDMKTLDMRLKKLCDKVITYFVEPVIRYRSTLLQEVQEQGKTTLCVTITPQVSQALAEGKDPDIVPPVEVFQKLQQVFLFLHRPLDGVTVEDVEQGSQSELLVQSIGNAMGKRLFDCIYHECLSFAIPKSNKKLESFNEVIALTEKFQNLMFKLKFVPADQSSLMDYFNNVSSLFANVRGQEILKRAHELFTHDLLKVTRLNTENPVGELLSPDTCKEYTCVTKEMESFIQTCRAEAKTGTVKLPSCSISVSVQCMVCLTYEVLQNCKKGSPECALHLSYTAQNLLELFCDFMPSYHEQRLQQLPKCIAVHYNNCMFISYHTLTLERQFREQVERSSVPSHRKEDVLLVDLGNKIKRMANEHFSDYVNQQKTMLCTLLEAAQGFECVADDDGVVCHQVLKKIVVQLKSLVAEWRHILPTNTFCKAVGTLVNAVVSDVIDLVLCIEEFSADDCDVLQSIYNYFTSNIVELFEGLKTNAQVILHENVPCWMKFQELLFVLSSRMQEVGDRWADGKGPLALYFSPEELQRLVIAIFEDTSKRDSLLAQLSEMILLHQKGLSMELGAVGL